jgi:hypothetical protein
MRTILLPCWFVKFCSQIMWSWKLHLVCKSPAVGSILKKLKLEIALGGWRLVSKRACCGLCDGDGVCRGEWILGWSVAAAGWKVAGVIVGAAGRSFSFHQTSSNNSSNRDGVPCCSPRVKSPSTTFQILSMHFQWPPLAECPFHTS